MKNKKMRVLRLSIAASAWLVVGCLVLAALILLTNASLPTRSPQVDRLSAEDKARLKEINHLRQSLGNQVLPGWGDVDIAVIAFNEETLFLVGIQDPPAGWRKIPQGTQLGAAWEPVPGDAFEGQPYYRQTRAAAGAHTENYTVQVGGHWAASLMSFEYMRIAMVQEIREDLPDPLKPLVPYRLVVDLFVPNSDTYIAGVLHEAVHAYQGMRAPERLAAAENAGLQMEGRYPWDSQSLQEAWQVELDILRDAMRAGTPDESTRLARAFLDQRAQRRQAAGLSEDLITYERQREWAEGIAKYGERQIYVLAASDAAYQPVPELDQDRAFDGYQGGQRKWDQEVDQISRMAGDEGDGRFYYSGFAQAVLLDRLAPAWKERLFDDGVWLDDLLAEALSTP